MSHGFRHRMEVGNSFESRHGWCGEGLGPIVVGQWSWQWQRLRDHQWAQFASWLFSPVGYGKLLQPDQWLPDGLTDSATILFPFHHSSWSFPGWKSVVYGHLNNTSSMWVFKAECFRVKKTRVEWSWVEQGKGARTRPILWSTRAIHHWVTLTPSMDPNSFRTRCGWLACFTSVTTA